MHIVNFILLLLAIWFAYVAWVFYKSIDGDVRVNLLCTFGSLSWSFSCGAALFQMTDHLFFLNNECIQITLCVVALAPLLASMWRLVRFVNKKYPNSFLT